LLFGYFDATQKLVFAGKVGTGRNNAQAVELRNQMKRLRREEHLFQVNGPDRPLQRRAHWVQLRLVGEVRFTE
jgi:ATP-dependent DNA ligase